MVVKFFNTAGRCFLTKKVEGIKKVSAESVLTYSSTQFGCSMFRNENEIDIHGTQRNCRELEYRAGLMYFR